MRKARFWTGAILMLAIFPLLSSCQERAVEKPGVKIKIQMPWVYQGSEANLYLALEQGLFKGQGFDIDLLPGGPGIDPVAPLVSGDAQFTLLEIATLLKAREEGLPLKALAVHYQRSPNTFVSLVASNIHRPEDFNGKSITFATPDQKALFLAMMGKLDVQQHVREVPYNYKYQGLLDGSVDISGAYAIGGVLRLKNRGIELNVLSPYDYGVRFYGRVLVARDDFITENPDLTRRFVRTFISSLQNLLTSPKEALDATMKYAKEKDASLQELMIRTSLPLISPGNTALGSFNKEQLAMINRILVDHGQLNDPSIWENAHTTEFLPAQR